MGQRAGRIPIVRPSASDFRIGAFHTRPASVLPGRRQKKVASHSGRVFIDYFEVSEARNVCVWRIRDSQHRHIHLGTHSTPISGRVTRSQAPGKMPKQRAHLTFSLSRLCLALSAPELRTHARVRVYQMANTASIYLLISHAHSSRFATGQHLESNRQIQDHCQ